MTREQRLTELRALCLEAGSLESCPPRVREAFAGFLSTGDMYKRQRPELLPDCWARLFNGVYWAFYDHRDDSYYLDSVVVWLEDIKKHDHST